MSSVDLEGSHATALRGGDECGYQGRKKRKTINAMYLTDRQGLPIVISAPKSGEHNDVNDIENIIKAMFEDMGKANIGIDGLFLNADAGFECHVLRRCLDRNGVVANICISRRRTDTDGIFVDELLYAENIPWNAPMNGWAVTGLCSIVLIRLSQAGNHGIISRLPCCFLRKFHENENFKSLH